MSRIGKQQIEIPSNVTVSVDGRAVHVKGPKGELVYRTHPAILAEVTDNRIVCKVVKKSKRSPALWGTTRANLANLVAGVTEGFQKKLELQGVGYRAAMKGTSLELQVGYSHPVTVEAPEGISFLVEKDVVTIEGIDRQLVGQVAADIRKVRKPEPYKGKGIRYLGEHVRRKVGKVVGSAE